MTLKSGASFMDCCRPGLVEIIRPEGMVVQQHPNTFPTQNKEEQKSLVNKLIGRIRSL